MHTLNLVFHLNTKKFEKYPPISLLPFIREPKPPFYEFLLQPFMENDKSVHCCDVGILPLNDLSKLSQKRKYGPRLLSLDSALFIFCLYVVHSYFSNILLYTRA